MKAVKTEINSYGSVIQKFQHGDNYFYEHCSRWESTYYLIISDVEIELTRLQYKSLFYSYLYDMGFISKSTFRKHFNKLYNIPC